MISLPSSFGSVRVLLFFFSLSVEVELIFFLVLLHGTDGASRSDREIGENPFYRRHAAEELQGGKMVNPVPNWDFMRANSDICCSR